MALFALVVVGFLVAGAMASDSRRRSEFFEVAGLDFMGLMLVGFMGGMMFGVIDSPAIESQKITIHELNVLSEEALRQKDYERAVMHLKTIQSRVQSDEAPKKVLKEKIQAIELQAVK